MKIMLPNFNFKIERWKWNKEYRVYVSTLGHIKDEYRRLMPIKIDQNGYSVVLTPIQCYKTVHRLVMLTWKSIPNAEDLTIDHLNHNKRENTIYNLEWVSKTENQDRALQDFLTEYIEPNNCVSGLYGGKNKFNSFENAAKWVLNMNGSPITEQSIERVIKRIKNAICQKKQYCKRNWRIIK